MIVWTFKYQYKLRIIFWCYPPRRTGIRLHLWLTLRVVDVVAMFCDYGSKSSLPQKAGGGHYSWQFDLVCVSVRNGSGQRTPDQDRAEILWSARFGPDWAEVFWTARFGLARTRPVQKFCYWHKRFFPICSGSETVLPNASFYTMWNIFICMHFSKSATIFFCVFQVLELLI